MPGILEVRQLTKKYGALVAIDRLDLAVTPGEILGLIGPNGSGKSSFFNVVSGVSAATGGQVVFQGKDITRLRPHQIAERGLARTFQKARVYGSMSVLKNVVIGAHCRTSTGVLGAIIRHKRVEEEERRVKEKAIELLELLGLKHKQDELAASLPLGQRKSLEIARALASQPTLLMVDEPAAGLTLDERRHLVDVLRRVRDEGRTIVLVEHSMEVVMGISDRIVVLNYGKKIFQGPPKEMSRNEVVIRAYLGEAEGDARA